MRSLLNRDSKRNLKFAHWSILEYLFVVRFCKAPEITWNALQLFNGKPIRWNEQMKQFYVECCYDQWDDIRGPIRGV
jgi:hypothetical protein